jgi:hypothetical protein
MATKTWGKLDGVSVADVNIPSNLCIPLLAIWTEKLLQNIEK